jgi:hypothetical protein
MTRQEKIVFLLLRGWKSPSWSSQLYCNVKHKFGGQIGVYWTLDDAFREEMRK